MKSTKLKLDLHRGVDSKNRIRLIANWKMNLDIRESLEYCQVIAQELDQISQNPALEIVLAPSTLALHSVHEYITSHNLINKISLASQNFYSEDKGAYTGETSVGAVRGMVGYGIIGHSERRRIFGESRQLIARKVAAAVRHGITPVLCIGETLKEKEDGHTKSVIIDQLSSGLAMISDREVAGLIIAYEPVWAIGSGKTANSEDIYSVIDSIYNYLLANYDRVTAESVEYLYGGSVDANNVEQFVGDTCNGALIGGASNTPAGFIEIISKFY
ncbi:triose-phosphate isomerase [Candidatus Saccharibacteria bacterium]|nr:triose-phosphate isomerase [Candidatus Saccharibacteria bacterium]